MRIRAGKRMVFPIAFGILILFTGSAISAELRDFALPSERQGNSTTQQAPMYPERAPSISRAIPESFYDDFRKDVGSLTSDQKAELGKVLQSRLDKAKSRAQTNVVEHNSRLLKILREK